MSDFEFLRDRTPGVIGMDAQSHYAVTVPLILKDGHWHVLFEVRSAGLRRQPGEICFPGGRVEDGESWSQAAGRELCEELVLNPDQCEEVAPLDLNISHTGQMIMPFLTILHDYQNTFNPSEVDEVFTVPLDYFLTHAPECYENEIMVKPSPHFPYERIPGGLHYPWAHAKTPVYFYMVNGRTIWGLTAKIMKSAAEIITSARTAKGPSSI